MICVSRIATGCALLILFSSCSFSKGLPVEIFRHWVHSYEEDGKGVQVFRPLGYTFPPSRGRDSFEMRPDVEYIWYGPGADDRTQARRGRWTQSGPSGVQVTFSGRDASEKFVILEVSPKLLRIRR